MIIDSREMPDGSEIAADLIIVGGGVAGITLAREWAGLAKTVAVLEAGGRDEDDADQDLYGGTATLSGDGASDENIDEYLVQSRARHYGGSGNWWGGKCVPLDEADFAERPWIAGSGWPMSRADLQPYYDRASDLLGIMRFDQDFAEPRLAGRPPLDINGARHVTSLPRAHTRVTGRGNNPEFDDFRYGFTEAENIFVHLHANVVDLNFADDGARLDSLGVATLDGKRHTARGTVYVLACGGIENARVLLAANARGGARFGARSDALGRYFQGHATISKDRGDGLAGTMIHVTDPPESLSLYTDRDPSAPHCVFGTTLAGQARYESPAFTVTIGTTDAQGDADERALRQAATRVDRGDANADGGAGCWCYFMTENLPNPDSRITLSDEVDALGTPRLHLRWVYGAADLDGYERSVAAFARELGSAGRGRVSAPIERGEIVGLLSPSRHHMGTTRMHADPAVGVVDPDLKSHDADNLYVAGSSVFPTSGIANPTFTIVALTLRLSDHLKQRLGA